MFSHYLMFNGDCSAALAVYSEAFGAQIAEKRTYGEIPDPGFPVPDDMRDRVLHSRLVWDGSELMCADASDTSQSGTNMFVSVTSSDEAQVRHAWELLAQGGEVYMDLAPSFFAVAHGSLRDRFGVNWMFTVSR